MCKKIKGTEIFYSLIIALFFYFYGARLSSLAPERSGIVELTIIGKIGTRTRVTSFTEDYTIADSNLYTWFCFGFYRILVRHRVGWSKYLFLANE